MATTVLIHISTDMVFSGNAENPGPYNETQIPDEPSEKLTWYGIPKAWGKRQSGKSSEISHNFEINLSRQSKNMKLNWII